MSHIDKASIEAGHNLVHLGQVDVSHGEMLLAHFSLKLYEPFVFQQSDGDFRPGSIYYQFACHKLYQSGVYGYMRWGA